VKPRVDTVKEVRLMQNNSQSHARRVAEQMAVWNVVNHVVEDAALEPEVEALAQRLAARPPGAYAVMKALLNLCR
jgi:enoyl-CoA hydratase/carnithine racemase